MTLRSGFRTALVVLAALMLRATPIRAQQQPVDSSAAAAVQRDLGQLAQILKDPNSDPAEKEEAAARLVSRQSREARQILADALMGAQPGGQLAAAIALRDDPQPDPSLIQPLFSALLAQPRDVSRALANYRSNPQVLNQFISLIIQTPVGEPTRSSLIRVMGSFPEKRSAETLVGLITNVNETATARRDAAEALADLTSISDYGSDAKRWSDWWMANKDHPDVEFRNEMLARRAARYDPLRLHNNELLASVKSILKSTYLDKTPKDQQPAMLLSGLKDRNAEVREIFVGFAREDFQFIRVFPQEVRQQLRMMVGDSRASVRIAVADTLTEINDPEALDPILAQLSQETDVTARGALARALGPISDARAVPVLLRLLDDPGVVADAAIALEQTWQKVHDNDDLASKTANALRDVLRRNPAGSGNDRLRELLVKAMIPLRQKSLVQGTLIPLLSDTNPAIRSAALKAIGETHDPNAASAILTAIEDSDEKVRGDAVTALGNLENAADYVQVLLKRFSDDSKQSVRDRAWVVLESIFPNMPSARLILIADKFLADPERHVTVLKATRDRLIIEKEEDTLATVRQDLGTVLLGLKEYKDAAENLRLSLEYKKQRQQTPKMVIFDLHDKLMTALMGDRQYDKAVEFAASVIRQDPAQQQLGGLIKQEADRLRDDEHLEDALKLIQSALKMDPPLAEQYVSQLRIIEEQVKSKITQRTVNFMDGSLQLAITPTTQPRIIASGQ